MTVAGGRLWFGYDQNTDFVDCNFGSVDASSGTAHLHRKATSSV